MTMNEISLSYEGPPKYLGQRDAPLEIPPEVVKRLFLAMDEDRDDRVSLFELKEYIKNQGLPI